MVKRIVALVFIFVCTTVAWMILGATIFARTESFGPRLQSKVASIWGTEQKQEPASASFTETITKKAKVESNGKTSYQTEETEAHRSLPLDSSRVNVAINLEPRQKGLLWYSTYKVNFAGSYTFTNNTDKDRDVALHLPYPAAQAIYDDLQVKVNGTPAQFSNSADGLTANAIVGAGRTVVFDVGYRSQGLDRWSYDFGDGVAQVRDFTLTMRTNFFNIDFPDNSLAPTLKQSNKDGWLLTWRYQSLVSGFKVAMVMPERLQPGPLAGQISLFAPVSLFFFFFLMFIITTLRNIELHPMNYFFLAAAFFAFHLLFAYLVDHISIHLAFVICSAVSILLVVTYLRLVTGMRFALVEAGVTQFIYLVLFSYAFFFKGFTGLAVTIGSILTLFVVMQMTGRIRWADKFAAAKAQPTRNPLNGESWVRG